MTAAWSRDQQPSICHSQWRLGLAGWWHAQCPDVSTVALASPPDAMRRWFPSSCCGSALGCCQQHVCMWSISSWHESVLTPGTTRYVIREFEDPVPVVDRMQVGRGDDIGGGPYRWALNDASLDNGDCWYLSVIVSAMIIEKVHGPVLDAVRQFQLGQSARQHRMPDRIKRLREVKRIDMD